MGEYPDIPDFNQKQHYSAYEIDFGRCILAKFTFNPEQFWEHQVFPPITSDALYPNNQDPMFDLANSISTELVSLLGPEE